MRVDHDHRRRALVEAGIAITSELSLDAILQTLVRIAAELTEARYSALGVIDRGAAMRKRQMRRQFLVEPVLQRPLQPLE